MSTKFVMNFDDDGEFKAIVDEYFKEMNFFDTEFKAKLAYITTLKENKLKVRDGYWKKIDRRLKELGHEVNEDDNVRVDEKTRQVFIEKEEKCDCPIHGGGDMKSVDVPGHGKGIEISGETAKALIRKILGDKK